MVMKGTNFVACLTCRSKHLKCDGTVPRCLRCSEAGANCLYAKSLRGWNRTRMARNGHTQFVRSAHLETVQRPQRLDDSLVAVNQPASLEDSELLNNDTDTVSILRASSHGEDYDYLDDVYYQNIHPAHPFVIPRTAYLQDKSVLPDSLKRTMHFVAVHTTNYESDSYRDRAQSILESSNIEDGFRVQGLILFALASYSRFERDEGNQALTQAIDIALRLKMDSDAFGADHEPILRESFRRTWWELYTLTTLISLITGASFKLPLSLEMTLPGHCEDYNSGRSSVIYSLEYMHDQCFMEQEGNFSSAAYRVEATLLLGKAMDLCKFDSPQTPLQRKALSASISAFNLSLPHNKRSCIKADGDTDEVMFCALVLINVASICLHFPQSSIKPVRSLSTICGNDGYKLLAEDCETSTIAACQAANAISGLIVARNSFSTLSPCMACPIALGTSVQLAAYTATQAGSGAENIAEFIKLTLSALKVMGQRWPIGIAIRGQMAQQAREILRGPARTQQATDEMIRQQSTSFLPLEDEPWMQDFLNEDCDVSVEMSIFDMAGLT